MAETKVYCERIQALLSMSADDEPAIMANLDQLVTEFGVEQIQGLCLPNSRQKNLLLHELVRLGLSKTIEHVVTKLKFDINAKRESDGNTPLHLAHWCKKENIAELLKHLQADTTIKNNYGESVSDLERTRESMMNIVWLDTGNVDYTTSFSCHRSLPWQHTNFFQINFLREGIGYISHFYH